MDMRTTPRVHRAEGVRAKLERIVLDHQSIKVEEYRQYVELLLLWMLVVEDVFLSWGICPLDYAVYVRWLRKTAATNIRTLASVFGSALDSLRRCETFEQARESFKGTQSQIGSEGLMLPLAHCFKCMPDDCRSGTNWFRITTQIVAFPFRANLDTPSLDEAWADYVRVDAECVDPPVGLVDELASAYSVLIDESDIQSQRFTPRHGPGAIAEWTSSYKGDRDLRSKYELARVPSIVLHALRIARVPYRDYGYPEIPTRLPCRFKPVPKSIGKTRTICIEPAGMQFYQQGLRVLLENVVSTSPVRRHIDFKDTSRSVDLARRGSEDGSFSTIDLSNASDRISYSLMRGIFRDSKLLPLLIACRSHTVRYGRSTRRLSKLHTSGSAACFPTETIIFAMMCQVAVWRTRRSSTEWSYYDYAVFGDDIVISTPCVPALLEILTACGAKINESKSFVGSSFTECCGFEFFKGKDVTPLRIPRQYRLWDLCKGAWYGDDVESFDQCIALANRCYDYGLLQLRQLLIRAVFRREDGIRNPAFGHSHIHSDFVRNDHLRKDERKSKDYQRTYLLSKRVVSRVGVNEIPGGQRANESPQLRTTDSDLLHWFVCSDLRPDDMLSYGQAVLERRSKLFRLTPFPREYAES